MCIQLYLYLYLLDFLPSTSQLANSSYRNVRLLGKRSCVTMEAMEGHIIGDYYEGVIGFSMICLLLQ